MHTLIIGARQIGKSTLIRRVLKELGRPVFGFETKKEEALSGQDGRSPMYIYPAGGERTQSAANLAGYCCGGRRPEVFLSAFDRFAPQLSDAPDGHIVVMDEIGLMETGSALFCQAIMRLLDGDAPVIAAVKDKSSPFLDAVKRHPNCRCFTITEENRDTLPEEVAAFVRLQFGGQM